MRRRKFSGLPLFVMHFWATADSFRSSENIIFDLKRATGKLVELVQKWDQFLAQYWQRYLALRFWGKMEIASLKYFVTRTTFFTISLTGLSTFCPQNALSNFLPWCYSYYCSLRGGSNLLDAKSLAILFRGAVDCNEQGFSSFRVCWKYISGIFLSIAIEHFSINLFLNLPYR